MSVQITLQNSASATVLDSVLHSVHVVLGGSGLERVQMLIEIFGALEI